MSTDETETAENTPARRGSAYLPVLPDGWAYRVSVQGPKGQTGTVTPTSDGGTLVEFRADGEPYTQTAPSLADGCKALAAGAKVLDQVAKGEERVAEARRNALSTLGANSGYPITQDDPRVGSTAPSDNG